MPSGTCYLVIYYYTILIEHIRTINSSDLLPRRMLYKNWKKKKNTLLKCLYKMSCWLLTVLYITIIGLLEWKVSCIQKYNSTGGMYTWYTIDVLWAYDLWMGFARSYYMYIAEKWLEIVRQFTWKNCEENVIYKKYWIRSRNRRTLSCVLDAGMSQPSSECTEMWDSHYHAMSCLVPYMDSVGVAII